MANCWKKRADSTLHELIARVPSIAGRHTFASRNSIRFFVRFRDPADPKSIEEISSTNLVALNGETVTVDEVALDITERHVTRVIRAKLPVAFSR